MVQRGDMVVVRPSETLPEDPDAKRLAGERLKCVYVTQAINTYVNCETLTQPPKRIVLRMADVERCG